MSTYEAKWDARLENWARWQHDGGKSAYPRISSIYAPAKWHHTQGTQPPHALAGEAVDTNELVLKLEPDLFMAIRARYCWTGPFEIRAEQLRIHPNTLRNRVSIAIEALEDLDRIRRRRLPKTELLGLLMPVAG